MADPVLRPQVRPARLRRLEAKGSAETAGPGAFAGPLAVVATAVWFGLVTGLLELSARLARDWAAPKVTLDVIRTNAHWRWMVPVSHLGIFAGFGIVLGLFALVRPRPAGRCAARVLCALSCLALLFTVRGLYPAACVVLACGLAAQMAPRLEARPRGFSRLVRRSLPALVAVVAALAGVEYRRVATAEAQALASLPPARPRSPNVLLIVMDTVRADGLSLYGYPRDTTPNLVRLARSCVRFDQARSPAPWTLPSHASMFTGRWPHELSTTVDRPLDATYPTLAEHLGRNGYATAGFVANTYYCNALYGLDRGFARYEDYYENREVSPSETFRSSTLGGRAEALAVASGLVSPRPLPRKSAATINRDALAWIAKQQGRPFFAFLNYIDAHGPYIPPEGAERRFSASAPSGGDPEATLKAYRKLRRGQAALGEDDRRRLDQLTREVVELRRGLYDDCVASLDAEIGRLFVELGRRGLLEDTLVVITADHGEHFGEHTLFGHGHSLYRPLVHVPLLVFPPSSKGPVGRVVAEPVSLRDLPATVADLVGLGARSPFTGASLARFWDPRPGATGLDASPVLCEVEHQPKHAPSPNIPASLGPLWSLVTRERVYIRHSDGREELYGLADDPSEASNLALSPTARPDLSPFRTALERVLGEDQAGRRRR